QGHGPSGLDRRRKGRQSKRRPGAGSPGRSGVPCVYGHARGAVADARAYLDELQHGSSPEEIQQAQRNLDEARATLANDKLTLDRTKELAGSGVLSRQQLDEATAKFESDQQRVNSLEKVFQLAKIGPRSEEIARAQGALMQAQGQLDYAQ